MIKSLSEKSKEWGTLEIIILVISICSVFYFLIFITWNYSNSDPQNRPSGLFWDTRKDGFKEDPLYDRYREE